MSKNQRQNFPNYQQKQTLKSYGSLKNYISKPFHMTTQNSNFCLTPKLKQEKNDFKLPKFIKHSSEQDLKASTKANNGESNCQKNILRLEQQTMKEIQRKTQKNQLKEKYSYGLDEKTEYKVNVYTMCHKNQKNNLKQTTSTGICENKVNHSPSFIKQRLPNKVKSQKLLQQGVQREDFKLIKKLGEGKFGKVYLAKDIRVGMIVALKIHNKKKIKQENLLNQFIRQLKIQAYINHPNIVQLYGFFHDHQNFYTIMELATDGHLYRLLQNKQPLTQQTTSYVTKSLLSAVCQLHKHRIIHRDIKPENIVLILGNVKLCDFGWAVEKKQELRSTFCGTPLYLSPEILKGEMYDQKVDLWAIGILTYELHIGCSPFKINNKAQLFKIVTDQIRFPDKPIVSQQFKQFINSVLKKTAMDRLNCEQLLKSKFIRKYQQLQTCQQLCKKIN